MQALRGVVPSRQAPLPRPAILRRSCLRSGQPAGQSPVLVPLAKGRCAPRSAREQTACARVARRPSGLLARYGLPGQACVTRCDKVANHGATRGYVRLNPRCVTRYEPSATRSGCGTCSSLNRICVTRYDSGNIPAVRTVGAGHSVCSQPERRSAG